MNKKGFILDTLTIAILLVLAFIILFAGMYIVQSLNTSTASSSGLNTTVSSLAWSGVPGAVDQGFILGFLSAIGFLLYSAYSIGTSPIMFALAFVVNAAVLMLMPAMEDLLAETFYNNNYAALNAAMPGMTFIINHYTLVFVGVTVLTILALYARPKQ